MTYYEILKIAPSASEEVIHMAYKALAKKYHPDVFQGSREEAEMKMKQINMAYSVLSDKEKRERYDAYLRNQQTAAGTESTEHKEETSPETERQKPHIVSVVMTVLLIVCAISLVGLFGRPANIETIKDSVVMIEAYDRDNELMATGSGFCAYKENWIVTNFHVIEGAYAINIVTDDNEVFSAKEVILFSPNEDLSIIATDGRLKPLKLGNGKDIQTKDNVTAIGSPRGEKNTVSEGIISNVDNKKEIRITAPISHGSSGGVLLNDKNRVIGITSAGYDEAQNLNFAINVFVLESLYSGYKDGDVTYLSYDNAWQYEGKLNDFENILTSNQSCFSSPSLSVFYSLTNRRERFESLLESEESRDIDTLSWYSIYRYFDEESKSLVLDVFTELNMYEFDDSNLEAEIASWDAVDFLVGLNILENYEYAIAAVDLANLNDADEAFYRVDEYPLNVAERCLVMSLIGGYAWDDIHTDDKEDIFDYFGEKYDNGEIETIEELGAVLEWLGYDVEYTDDGLSAYW